MSALSGMIMPAKRWITFALLAAVVCILSSWVLFSNVAKTEFHGDESGWISSAYYYTSLLKKRDFNSEKWECEKCGPWGGLNMQLGKWLIEVPVALDAQMRDREFFGLYAFDKSRQENFLEQRVPPQDILYRARTGSAMFGVLCCVCLFAIGYFVQNVWIGFMAALLLIPNRQFIQYATRAMTDIHYNFFLLCLCLTVLLLFRVYEKKPIFLISLLCGVLAGLASSIKVTGIIIGGALFLSAAIWLFRLRRFRLKEIFLLFGAFSFTALIVIYGLNPYFWLSPKQMRGRVLAPELKKLAEDSRSGKFQIEGARQRYPGIYSLLKFPLMFVRWNRLMENQQHIYKSASWGGNRFISFHKKLFVEYGTFPFEWIFFALGLLWYVRHSFAISSRSEINQDLWQIPFLYFLINYLFILLFLKLNWGRYYLPTILAGRILVAVGIYAVIRWLISYLGKRQQLRIVL